MSAVTDALDATKSILADIDPSPQPDPVGIWVYPSDYQVIRMAQLPILIVSQVVNQDRGWGLATFGRGRHRWDMEILAYLAPGPLTDDPQSAVAEMRQDPWPIAMAAILSQNLQLNETVRRIGDDENLFTYRVGHINWWSDVYWGIRFVVPILQEPVQTRGA